MASSTPKPELALEAVSELRELLELDPEVKEPEVELETLLAASTDELEPVAAIGVETLFACKESGRGKASVTDELAPLRPTGAVYGISHDMGGAGGLNFAVAGEIRTKCNRLEGQYRDSQANDILGRDKQ